MLKRILFVEGSGKVFLILFGVFFLFVYGSNLIFYDSFQEPSSKRIFTYSLITVLVPFLLMPGPMWVSLKVPLFESWKNALTHVLFNLVFVLFFVFLMQTILLALSGYFIFNESIEFIFRMLKDQLVVTGSIAFMTYWGIVVFYGMQKYYNDVTEVNKRVTEIESQLSQATLSALKAQLKPHFLFNTLNLVDHLIQTDVKKAIDTVSKLEDLLKGTFDQNQPNACTIDAEIRFIKKYLDIEKARFDSRLGVEIDIDEETRGVHIPCYLIQPLVENSIKHGVGKSLGKCTIIIRSYFEGDHLTIEVLDDGTGNSKQPLKSDWSIGLRNVEERVKIFFGPAAYMKAGVETQGGFRSSIIIPTNYLGE